MPTKVNIHINVNDMTIAEFETLRTKIQNFLDTEPDAKLLTYSFVEEYEEPAP